MLYTPRLTKVKFHQAYTIQIPGESAIVYNPSMTAIDEDGRVWRTTFIPTSGWQPWSHVSEFEH